MWTFFGKLHPSIVHFPIALLILTCVFEYLRFRGGDAASRHAPSKMALALALLGCAAAWVAAAAGLSDAETSGHGGSDAATLQFHRNLGLATAAASTIAALLAVAASKIESRTRFVYYRIGIVICAALVSAAGHLGGKLVYGESYLSDAWEAATSRGASSSASNEFDYSIMPILTKRCFACHTGEKPESEFSLATRERALKGGKSGKPAIVPRNSKDSRLIAMITGAPGATLMPPRGKPLAAAEIDIIKKWIDGGAAWSAPGDGSPREHWHWAYRKPARPALPEVKDNAWPRNAIDYFILEQLENEGLRPSPETDRATLLRRVSLDLTGLPPTVGEVDAFVHNHSADAYESAVDRLLASPRFGERFARPWLDLARYADTQGYEKDNRRSMWPWRDWLIDALNADMPFDEFTKELIAGDLLPSATMAQRVATGFHRNTMINEEGGVDPEEFRVDAVIDRANTTATVWLGSTLGCAQCHDHKFDPFTSKDYYQFLAFFNNTEDEVDHSGFESIANGRSTLRVPAREHRERFEALNAAVERLTKDIAAAPPDDEKARSLFSANILHDRNSGAWSPLARAVARSANGATLTVGSDGVTIASGKASEKDIYTIEANCNKSRITALKLELLPDATLPAGGAGRAGNGNLVLNEITVSAGGAPPVRWAAAQADYEQEPLPDGSARWGIAGAIDGSEDAGQGWAIGGEVTKPHAAVLMPEAPIELPAGGKIVIRLVQNYGGHTIGKFKISVRDDEIKELPPPATDAMAAIVAPLGSIKSENTAAFEEIYKKFRPEAARARVDLLKAKAELAKIPAGDVYVLKERGEPRESHVFIKGNFLNKGERVVAEFPAVLARAPAGTKRDRLALANWLVGADNPLTARVQVNRWWSLIFGRGIVETEEDFGTRGDEPTHPKLLDWCATELMQRGWSMKSMLRLFVTSAVYRQSSRCSDDLREKDPYNKLYARGPRFRLEAEMLRDSELAIAGLLSSRMGGPSVFPPQPDGLWTMIYNSDQWMNSKGDDRYRRGIYTFWRRTAPYPTFTTFDAPTRETSCTRRPRTNTPLQALTILNDPQFVEAAVALGRSMAARGEAREGIRYGFVACTSREPSDAETARLLKLLEEEREAFAKDPSAAAKFLNVHPSETPASGALPADLAAWGVVANVLLNLDETLVKS
ncbi:MAG: PSD1 domain-containing protein [Planctomycetes bacterium]|nr:PSD1 domain-containing protein [Planctomycetota bacterium]